jgi:predicted transcriptional regulator
MSEILMITDLLDIRARKMKELQFYTEQLEELKLKMVFIQQEITLTNRIIDMIEKEAIIDIGLHIKRTT